MSEVGHNRGGTNPQLIALLERVENLEEEKATISTDIREVKAEAKSQGFDMKMFNEMLKLRKMSAAEREERLALFDTYLTAVGLG